MGTFTTSFISFKINDVDLALDTICIKGILEDSKSTPVPNADGRIEGMIEYLGSVVTQIDIHKYLFNSKRDKSIHHPLLVCETDKAAIAFKVDSINGIYEIDNSEMIQLDAIVKSRSNMVKEVFNHKGNINQVLDIEFIYNDVCKEIVVND